MTDIPDVLSRVSCIDVAEEIGIECDQHGRTPCFHDGLDAHENRSVKITDDLWFCHRCGVGGTAIELLMQAKGFTWYRAVVTLEEWGENKPARVERAAPAEQRTFDITDLPGVWPRPDPEQLQFAQRRYGSLFWNPDHNVWPVRGGYAFCYPVYDENGNALSDQFEGVKFRFFDGGKSSLPGSKFTHLWHPYAGFGTAVLCEGESDALAMSVYVYSNQPAVPPAAVYSLPSGAGKWDERWLHTFRSYSRVFVCMDNDTAGRQAADKILRSSRWGFDRLEVPGLYNDAEEALRNGWAPNLWV